MPEATKFAVFYGDDGEVVMGVYPDSDGLLDRVPEFISQPGLTRLVADIADFEESLRAAAAAGVWEDDARRAYLYTEALIQLKPVRPNLREPQPRTEATPPVVR
jgi:hypothetical protein